MRPSFPSLGLATVALLSPVLAKSPDLPRDASALPLERFDNFPAGNLPLPWRTIGGGDPAVTVQLTPDAESPFIANTVTGKGVELTDSSPTAGQGIGFSTAFPPPPPGRLFLGFDFQIKAGDGLDLRCQLLDARGRGPTLQLGEGGSLTAWTDSKSVQRLAAVRPGQWYRLTLDFSATGKADLTLTDSSEPKKPLSIGSLQCEAGAAYQSLRFFSNAEARRTGAWMVDNIAMAGEVDSPRENWLPFKPAPLEKLRATDRKVFAYYFEIFTSEYSDGDPGLNHYTTTLFNPTYTNTRPWLKDRIPAGTEFLYHPLPRPRMEPGLTPTQVLGKAMEEEIRLANRMGLDGFLLDFFAFPQPTGGTATFNERSFSLLDASGRVDRNFKIIPAIYAGDIPAEVSGDALDKAEEDLAARYANSPVVKQALSHPQTLHAPDGRPYLSMWGTERFRPRFWAKVEELLKAQGMPVAFVGQFNGVPRERLATYSSVCQGMSDWGPRAPKSSEPNPYNWVSRVRDLTKLVISPAVFQDVRTRGTAYWESCNSEAFRDMWSTAIQDKPDWVFIHTWSDYTEQAQAPSTAIGFSIFDLDTFYAQWFKTGTQPKIERDVLYYFYRRNRTNTVPLKGSPWTLTRGPADYNQIELLGFLTKPGELRIEAGGEDHVQKAPAGIFSFKVPMPAGRDFVPRFSLYRRGKAVLAGDGDYSIRDKVEYANLLYHGGIIANSH